MKKRAESVVNKLVMPFVTLLLCIYHELPKYVYCITSEISLSHCCFAFMLLSHFGEFDCDSTAN